MVVAGKCSKLTAGAIRKQRTRRVKEGDVCGSEPSQMPLLKVTWCYKAHGRRHPDKNRNVALTPCGRFLEVIRDERRRAHIGKSWNKQYVVVETMLRSVDGGYNETPLDAFRLGKLVRWRLGKVVFPVEVS